MWSLGLRSKLELLEDRGWLGKGWPVVFALVRADDG